MNFLNSLEKSECIFPSPTKLKEKKKEKEKKKLQSNIPRLIKSSQGK